MILGEKGWIFGSEMVNGKQTEFKSTISAKNYAQYLTKNNDNGMFLPLGNKDFFYQVVYRLVLSLQYLTSLINCVSDARI